MCERGIARPGSDYTYESRQLREQIEQEARAARRPRRTADDAVADACGEAAAILRERRDRGARREPADARRRPDTRRGHARPAPPRRRDASTRWPAQVEATAALEPLEREIGSRTLPNGLVVSERRIPIGTVGANFEARPNVALDVAGQLLKSLNAAVLRTGGAALRTVTVLVDDVLRPALNTPGCRRRRSGSSARRTATGLVRSSRCRRWSRS